MDHLQTEARNPAAADLDGLSALGLVRLMCAEDARVAPAVAAEAVAVARAVEVIAERMKAGGRLVYAGAGTSGRLGVLDAAECPPTFNADPGQVVGVIAGGPAAVTRAVEGAEDRPECGRSDLEAIDFTARDVLVGIATSGRTPYVLGAVAYARSLGAFTVGLSCNPDSELIPLVDQPITPVPGPEVLSGSTRLKAGTATKLVLNMLSTGAMVLLGKTFGDLMVDLRATNEKLQARSNRIVRQLTGLDRDGADGLLAGCGRELKTALVSHLGGVSPDQARARLRASGGRVRKALGANGVHKAAAPKGLNDDLVLGLDGGGTSTVALLARRAGGRAGAWELLGRGVAGPSNPHAVGTGRALRSLDEAVERAFAAAGVPRKPVRAACLGVAGAGRPDDQRVIAGWADRVGLAHAVDVTGDAPLLPAAGTPDGWGAAVVAGTGSMAFATDRAGLTARAGGWGHLLGDEGSGYALALAGLQAVARAADGRGPATLLTDRLLDEFGLDRPEEMIRAVYGGATDRTSVAALAPLVLALADAGDRVAASLAADAAGHLALAVAAAARQLDLGPTFPLAVAGGLLLNSAGYQARLLDALRARGLRPDPVTLVREPAEGAVRLALAAAGRAQLALNGKH